LRGRIHRKAMRWIRPLAFFGGLPPPMEHERKLAAQAVATARIVIHRETPHAQLDITWVRLTLPDARWAHVLFSSTEGKGWFAVLHRAHGFPHRFGRGPQARAGKVERFVEAVEQFRNARLANRRRSHRGRR